MKKGKFFGSMLTIAFASIFVLASCTNKTKQEEAREDVKEDVIELKQDVKEDMRDFNNYTYVEKEKFVADANEELKGINAEIAELKAELDRAGDTFSVETKAAYNKSIVELEVLRDEYKKNIDKVQNSTEETWDKTKKDVGDTYNKAKKGVKKGWDDMKRGVNEGVNKVKDKLD